MLVVDGADGSVRLLPAPVEGEPWAAITKPMVGTAAIVTWTQRRGAPTTYTCRVHGTGTRRDLCEHTRAATTARAIAEREYGRAS